MELPNLLQLSFCLILFSYAQGQHWGKLSEAVQAIIHPNAQPTLGMINVAFRQQSLPKTFAEMMEYTPYFVDAAMRMGVRPPGINGNVTHEEMAKYIVKQGQAWLQSQEAAVAAAAGASSGAGTNSASGVQRGHTKISLLDLVKLMRMNGNKGPNMAPNMAARMAANRALVPVSPTSFQGMQRNWRSRAHMNRMHSDLRQDMAEVMADMMPLISMGLLGGANQMFGSGGPRRAGMSQALMPLATMRHLDMDVPAFMPPF